MVAKVFWAPRQPVEEVIELLKNLLKRGCGTALQ
jgi:hypothetical protein